MPKCKNAPESNFQAVIGKNIREIRKRRGYTLSKLSYLFQCASNMEISPITIGAWERGEKHISAVELHYIAKALQCSEQALFTDKDSFTDFQMYLQEASALTEPGKQTLLYAATQWDGNRPALVAFIRMYMALNKKHRADVIGMGIYMYKKAQESGQLLKDAPPPDIEYIEQEWEKLMK